MNSKQPILVSSLIETVNSYANKHCEIYLPSEAKELITANMQNKNIRISEGAESLKFHTSVNARLVYVEHQTLALRVYTFTLDATEFERRECFATGTHYETSLAPDSGISLYLTKPNKIAVHAQFHVVAKVFSKQQLPEKQLNSKQSGIRIKENVLDIPGVGTITISLED